MKKVYIGNDHAAVAMKNELVEYIKGLGFEVVNVGTDTEERVDYPVYAVKVAKAVAQDKDALGVLICGTGIGMSLAAKQDTRYQSRRSKRGLQRKAHPYA